MRPLTLDRSCEDRPIATPLPVTSRSSPRQTWDTLVALSASDLRIRYGRGPIRAVKWLLDPIAALAVYLLLIVFVIDDSGEAAGLSIACAVVPFQLVMMTVSNSMRAIELRRQIVSNMAFPRSLIPVACTMTETLGFAACLLMLPVMMIAYGVALTPWVLLTPFALAMTFALSLALAYPATLIGLWVPELALVVISATRTLYFIAPGLVALNEVYGHTHDLLKINPLTGVFETYRALLLYGRAPSAWMVLVPLGYTVVLLATFVPLFRREQSHFAKLLM